MADDIETKLAAARTRLILDKPFLGALVMRLPMVQADPNWCHTIATDAKTFYYNRQYIHSLTLDQTQFALAHEALHCALSHFARKQSRIKKRWDVACDYAINPLLTKDGLTPTPDVLMLDDFDNMTAEEIYPYIRENSDEQTHDQHIYDDEGDSKPKRKEGKSDQKPDEGSDGNNSQGETDSEQGGASQPPPLGAGEKEALSIQWQQRMAGAAQQAIHAGKMSGTMARIVDHLLQPQLPWRMLLARYMTSAARDDYNFMRPTNRREGPAILPSLRSNQAELAIVLDTSGSVSDEEMHAFLSEINAIKGQMRARITLHACDEHLAEAGPWVFEAWEELNLPPEIEGGGGTSFVPAFEWADQLERQPDLFLYFTDAEGVFPDQPPTYPVLWLVKGKETVPWGQRIQLN